MVLTITSRASTLESSPMPIFQLKPSGAIAGSMKCPRRPITLVGQFRRGQRAACRVHHRQMRQHPQRQRHGTITVPALRRKMRARSISRSASERSVGMRYCGSSRMNGVSLDLRMELLSSRAVVKAATNPAR